MNLDGRLSDLERRTDPARMSDAELEEAGAGLPDTWIHWLEGLPDEALAEIVAGVPLPAVYATYGSPQDDGATDDES